MRNGHKEESGILELVLCRSYRCLTAVRAVIVALLRRMALGARRCGPIMVRLLVATVWTVWLLGYASTQPAPLAPQTGKLPYWDQQRKGANCFNRDCDRAYFAAARAAGIRVVRLTWSKWKGAGRDFLLGNADDFKGIPPADPQRLREVLDWAAAEDVKIVVVPLSLPGMRWQQQNDGRFDARLWTDFKYHRQAAAFWKELASALRGHPAVVAYNLVNEPAPARAMKVDLADRAAREAFEKRVAGTAADVNTLYASLILAVRAVDPDTPILLDGGDFAAPAHIDFLRPVADQRTLYAVHCYEPWNYTTFQINGGKIPYPGPEVVQRELAQVDAWARRNGVPAHRIILSEFGCDRRVPGVEQYLSDVIKSANGFGWHWAFYAFREDEWDGLDYELGPGKRPYSYWQAIERGEHPAPPRKDNPIWRVLAREFQP